MITGNFAVDVCGVHTRVDYVVEPPEGTFKEYDFIIRPDSVTVENATPDVENVMLGGLINLVYTRVKEQTNLTPKYIGIKVD